MTIISTIFNGIADFFQSMFTNISDVASAASDPSAMYTMIARWVFIALAAFVLIRAIVSLLRSSSPSEVWGFLHTEDNRNIPITHWENAIGRAKTSDVILDGMGVSRSHGTLNRDSQGDWYYMDLGSKNGAYINGKKTTAYEPVKVKAGDDMNIGGVSCTLYPMSIEERMNNKKIREKDTDIMPPWSSFAAITVFQIMTMIQLKFALGNDYNTGITISFIGIAVVMWVYAISLRSMKRRGFEIETIAFLLSTISLAVMATAFPSQVFKQFIAVTIGVALFFLMCTYLRDLQRTERLKNFMYIAAALLFMVNLVFGQTKYGARNWISIGGMSIQPSEIVKLAFIWVGASSMNELFKRIDNIKFTVFSIFCFICLALMGDFGTALIFFVTFVVISFLRSGDFTKLIMVLGVAFVGGLLVIRFRSYVASRINVWGHVWEHANEAGGFQQTRTMSAAASGGFVGVGAGNGWLSRLGASQTDLVFGIVTEEWGFIIAILAVLSIVTLAVFAFRSIWAGRSTYYTIAACAATTLFLFQTILNVFGSVDLLPLTGVTFPFLSAGGTSMISSWGMLAFLKAADTRQGASIAVSNSNKGFSDDRTGIFDKVNSSIFEGGKHGA
jgi:cell division protein FtsW